MNNNKYITFVLFLVIFTVNANASGPYSGPAIHGESGQVSVRLEGEKLKSREISLDASIFYASIGGLPLPTNVPEDDFNVDEENAGLGISYIVSNSVELFGSLSEGIQNKNSSGDSKSHSSYGVGIKFVPNQSRSLKLGFVAQMLQINSEYDGQYLPYFRFESATDYYYLNTPIPGEEKITQTIYNIGFSMGFVTNTVEPYLGVSLSKVIGTYEFSANGTSDVSTYPKSGGVGTNTTENVSLAYEADLVTSNYYEAFLGVRFKPENNLFLDLEARLLLQKGFVFSVGYIF